LTHRWRSSSWRPSRSQPRRPALGEGETVIVHGAASGVGLQGVQLAAHLGAGEVIATVRSLRARDLLMELGATRVVDTTEDDFAEVALAVSDGCGADVVIDHVGGPYLAANIRAMAIKGRLVSVGRLGGATGELDLEALAFKRLELIGVTFRTRTTDEKTDLVAALRRDLTGALDQGLLKPTIADAMPWTEVGDAQERMAANDHIGKLVLRVGD